MAKRDCPLLGVLCPRLQITECAAIKKRLEPSPLVPGCVHCLSLLIMPELPRQQASDEFILGERFAIVHLDHAGSQRGITERQPRLLAPFDILRVLLLRSRASLKRLLQARPLSCCCRLFPAQATLILIMRDRCFEFIDGGVSNDIDTVVT